MDEISTKILKVVNADSVSFTNLVEIAELDPATDFQFKNLKDVDFSGCDLSGFNFHGSLLDNSIFQDSLISKALFDEDHIVIHGLEQASDYDSLVERFSRGWELVDLLKYADIFAQQIPDDVSKIDSYITILDKIPIHLREATTIVAINKIASIEHKFYRERAARKLLSYAPRGSFNAFYNMYFGSGYFPADAGFIRKLAGLASSKARNNIIQLFRDHTYIGKYKKAFRNFLNVIKEIHHK